MSHRLRPAVPPSARVRAAPPRSAGGTRAVVGLVSDRDLRDTSPPRGSTGERDALNWSRLGDIMSTGLTTVHPLDTIEHETGQRPKINPHAIEVKVGVGQLLTLSEGGYTVIRP